MDNTDSTLVRPGDPRVPCLAILGFDPSELKLVNLEGGSSTSVIISDHRPRGIVTNDGEVYAVTDQEILILRISGRKEILRKLRDRLDWNSQVISFQKKIYIIQPGGKRILCFDPADNSLNDDLPGCGLDWGFCASATDDFICAMGGSATANWSVKYDPLTITWEETAPMKKKRCGAAAATLDGKVYVMGGTGDDDTSVEYYNPGNNSWTEIAKMNVGHTYFIACVVGDRLYAVSGDGEKKIGFYLHSIEVYNKNKWTVVAKFKIKHGRTYSCFWPHGLIQPGDGVLNEVKAQVGQLAIDNATVAEQGAESNFDAGIIKITDDIFMNKEKPVKEGANIYEGYQEHVGGQKLPLAIKVIIPSTKKSIKEIQHLISLASHPNVVRIISSKEHNYALPTLYIAMELCSSQNLQDYLNENRKKNIAFDFKKTMSHAEGLIHGIKHIHCKRIIHGDLKPANILFSLDGDQIKLSDFGISKDLQQSKSSTKITSQGTDGYRAPETYNSDVISMKADIHSLGIILYSLFANGKHPFGEDLDLCPYNIKKNVGRDFSGLPEEMGVKKDELLELLEKMMEFNPEKRPTIEEISEHPFFNSNRATKTQGSSNIGFKMGDGGAVTFNNSTYIVHVHSDTAATAVGFDLGAQGTVNIQGNVDVHAGAKGGQNVEEVKESQKKGK